MKKNLKLIIFIIFLQICSLKNLLAIDSISEVIDEINNIEVSGLGNPYYGVCTLKSDNYGSGNALIDAPKIKFLKREERLELDCPLNSENVCEKVSRECNLRHSNNHRGFKLIAPADPIPLKNNLYYSNQNCFSHTLNRSEEDQAQILKQAVQSFYYLTLNESENSLGHLCCQGKLTTSQSLECREQFKNTRLILINDSTQLIANSGKDKLGNFVTVSRAILSGCLNMECFERLFFHELGHSCNYARRVARGKHYYPYDYNNCNDTTISESEFSVLSKNLSSCLKNSLSFHANNKITIDGEKAILSDISNDQACLGSWMIEAFANAIFFEKWNSFGHLAWTCSSAQDKLHAQGQIYMQCLLDTPEAKKNFCPTKSQ